tara:strand:+ start:3113 stop:3313 length:201 start_codon:yes stop_codon:yes gene_type:complete
MVLEGIMGTPLPCTGSHEGAGTIVSIGYDVQGFSIGERVMAGMIYMPAARVLIAGTRELSTILPAQ